MRILFVHQNFPGQFKHLAPALVKRGHDVLALTPTSNTRPDIVSCARYTWAPRAFDSETFRLSKTFASMVCRGEVVAGAARDLSERHKFVPDVVFGTPGWGETLFLKDVWPEARHIMYGEFFYGPRGPLVGFDPEFQRTDLAARMTITADHAYLLLATESCDKILTPTQWQAASFPAHLQARITVVHDGIDTASLRPQAVTIKLPGSESVIKTGDEVLTFINRNLEPHRGFHIFMRALPEVLKARPNAQVVIIGGDGVSYSPKAPNNKTWRERLVDEAGDRLDLSRVHFAGRVPYNVFVDLMRASRVHAYLTYPFVLSWSLLEAMSAGAFVIGSRTAPVEEVIQDGVNGRLVDFFDIQAWSAALIEGLSHPERFEHLRAAARKTIVERYDLQTRCLPKAIAFVESA